jgi:hypothetical protein
MRRAFRVMREWFVLSPPRASRFFDFEASQGARQPHNGRAWRYAREETLERLINLVTLSARIVGRP